MASFRKHNKGWRAEIMRKGVRRSKVLPTKREAQDWASREEYLILNGPEIAAAQPFCDVLERYGREVSPSHRGERWEVMRLRVIGESFLGKIPVRDLRAQDFARWRDARLQDVSPGTVIREMTLLSAVLGVARREWELLSSNPMEGVRKPPAPRARSRLVTTEEMEKLKHSAGADLTHRTARAYHAFAFACETAMRAGEIIGLTRDRVDLSRRVAHLDMTKNGQSRDVPLSLAAVEMIEALPPDLDPVFGLNTRQLDSLWRKLRDRAGVEGLTFHDSRHYAITQLSRKLDVLALAKMVGHQNISQLMAYYDAPAEDLARRLD